MGMAASQARLLSITSRLADNELRAQLINNSKMRLATESSKVSEEYVSALNSATMMMSNYDIEGNSQYQQLTFNALTAYSSHNNQYGLVDANGRILVSEDDAVKFRNANGDLDIFLAEYGLVYSTHYFSKDILGGDSVQIRETNEYLEEDQHYTIGTYPIEQLETMYFGGEYGGITYIGYNNELQSINYSDYCELYENFSMIYEKYNNAENIIKDARDALIKFVLGTNDPNNATVKALQEKPEKLLYPGWILAEHANAISNEFKTIENIFILDSLFNIYGEPAMGWIDENNPKENADAKVQWYTNLFNRMKEGYRVLEDGLASSNQWIQFALESGLVTMEQVDGKNMWVSMTHANCSDITEVMDDVMIAKAEAEYNKAMNNIENKDKRFDMELKNIDTEHNALQTEYDSIKNVIGKNIERSFKIYS